MKALYNANDKLYYSWTFTSKEIIILRKLAAGHLGSGRSTKVLSPWGEETFSYLS